MISNASVSSFLSLQLAEFDDRLTSSESQWHSSSDVGMTTTVSLGEDDHESPTQRDESTMMVGEFVYFPCSPPYAVQSSCKRTSPITAQPQESHTSLPDLSISPLTASSYHTMERHYNQDTWRLHTRIKAARSHRQIGRTSTDFDSSHGLLLNGTDSNCDLTSTPVAAAADLSCRRVLVLQAFLTSLSGRLTELSNSINSEREMINEKDEDEDTLCIFDLDLGES
jgi:hypothetical protein